MNWLRIEVVIALEGMGICHVRVYIYMAVCIRRITQVAGWSFHEVANELCRPELVRLPLVAELVGIPATTKPASVMALIHDAITRSKTGQRVVWWEGKTW